MQLPPTREMSQAAGWLLRSGHAPSGVSELGDVVAQVLDRVFGGIHNLPLPKNNATDWSDPYSIRVVIAHTSLGSVDDNRLTSLVVLCHDAVLRVSLSARAYRHLDIIFHQRLRGGALFERCPTIEDHITTIRHSGRPKL